MSDTPRTNAQVIAEGNVAGGVVPAEFARQLEVERNSYAAAAEKAVMRNVALSAARRTEDGGQWLGDKEHWSAASSERAQLLEDALDDVKRLHAEKMKFFERTIELERQLAAVSATSPSEDEARLLWLEKVLQHCPHAELTHNDDEDDGPVGWSLAIESCSRMDLQAPTLAALIDLGMNTEPDEDGDVVARSEGRGA